jgi:hypothetical protein
VSKFSEPEALARRLRSLEESERYISRTTELSERYDGRKKQNCGSPADYEIPPSSNARGIAPGNPLPGEWKISGGVPTQRACRQVEASADLAPCWASEKSGVFHKTLDRPVPRIDIRPCKICFLMDRVK